MKKIDRVRIAFVCISQNGPIYLGISLLRPTFVTKYISGFIAGIKSRSVMFDWKMFAFLFLLLLCFCQLIPNQGCARVFIVINFLLYKLPRELKSKSRPYIQREVYGNLCLNRVEHIQEAIFTILKQMAGRSVQIMI